MDRVWPTLVIIAVLGAVIALMAMGWRARRRRQSAVSRPQAVPDALGPAALSIDGYYVATTPSGEPLERIAVHGLGFRSRTTVSVHDEGLVIALRGAATVHVPTRDLRGVGQATWAIDRVVEKDGLVVVMWMLGSMLVDSYFRVTDRAEATALIAAVADLVSLAEPREGIAS
ncbi:MAG: hypothetical protein KIT89_03100 [Microcella sp.]|uniref:PH-like domain-containing protein n=1 Tax=Microcella sp. TaxID=1913979 RepID=UPI0024C5824F|nr:hypothetical protein [Microcella sp.]UYN84210.1 MAG: hypothetical protein KIT89_03100 [Microcella sp.]